MLIRPFRLARLAAQVGPWTLAGLSLIAACAGPAAIAPLTLPFPVDSSVTRQVDRGVVERYIWSSKGPWAIHVLDVDLSRGYCAIAAKGAPGAVGRKKTSQLLAELNATREVLGGVNADFFSLAGFQGVPVGPLIENGRVIVGPGEASGPGARAALSIDSSGVADVLSLTRTLGTVTHRAVIRRFSAWNRPAPGGIAVYDRNWGTALDTASGRIEVTLDALSPGRVVRVDTTTAGATIPASGAVMIVGRNAPDELKAWARELKPGEIIRVGLTLSARAPKEMVGGRPVLALRGEVQSWIDTSGQASFRARNPRTAVGVASAGRRLILVVVDGRQSPYSDGMTLRETAELLLALGARDAINLDGGGSSTLVYRDPATRSHRIANRPSDPTGERPVGDALAIVKGCR
jgi:hypothetical protein